MENFSALFLEFIQNWGYVAVAVLMALENACIPIPSELILGFAGYLIFADKMTFTGATTAGMIGGIAGSVITYYIGSWGGRPFVEKYGKYMFMKHSHVEQAQRWFDKYGIKAVFFSRLLPVVRTFISLPAGFARVNFSKFVIYTFLGSLPWTIFILYLGYVLGNNWERLLAIGHEASLLVVAALALIVIIWYWKKKRKK